MKITKDTVINIAYQLKISNEDTPSQLAETASEDNPMTILYGSSGLPEKFETELKDMEENQNFNFTIDKLDGYGDYNDEDIVDLPLNDFLNNENKLEEEVQVGKTIPMVDEEGYQVFGRVLEINPAEEFIKMDFNHPLAGFDLYFEGKILSVRKATEEEITHGHVHGEGGHHH